MEWIMVFIVLLIIVFALMGLTNHQNAKNIHERNISRPMTPSREDYIDDQKSKARKNYFIVFVLIAFLIFLAIAAIRQS